LLYPFNYQGNKKYCKGSHFCGKYTTFAIENYKNIKNYGKISH
jgi:hypothetical protein